MMSYLLKSRVRIRIYVIKICFGNFQKENIYIKIYNVSLEFFVSIHLSNSIQFNSEIQKSRKCCKYIFSFLNKLVFVVFFSRIFKFLQFEKYKK